jgi:small GTP-binding protein
LVIKIHLFTMSLKIGIVGTSGVGKTQFIDRLEGKKFDRCYNLTDQYDIRNICYRDKDIQFRDFAGTQYYMTDNDLFFDLDVLIFMVDNTEISYKNGRKAVSKILTKYAPKKVVLVQNKIDIIEDNKLLSRASKISVKNNEGIQELMDDILTQ